MRTKPHQSRLWRDLLSFRASFDSMVHYRIGTEDRIRFWLDTWVEEASLASQFPNLFRCTRDVSAMVRDRFSKNGEQVVWNPIFRRNLGEGEIEDFAALLVVLDSVFIVDGRKDESLDRHN